MHTVVIGTATWCENCTTLKETRTLSDESSAMRSRMYGIPLKSSLKVGAKRITCLPAAISYFM